MNSMIPFFVADRPMSLRLLKGLPLGDYPQTRIGIMAHANTTKEFQRALCEYPCDAPSYCDAIQGPCTYANHEGDCPSRARILCQTTKMCDSGIFTKEGATLGYRELFETYNRMDVEYGVMIDVFGDARGTVQSAREATKVYKQAKYTFRLVGVAQGKDENEYLDCYEKLKDLGVEYVAVGGLLRRRQDTVRFALVSDEDSLYSVLGAIREKYPKDWLFALGCFHPGRLQRLSEIGAWADYKGWIFQYEKRNTTLDPILSALGSNHLEHLDDDRVRGIKIGLQEAIQERQRCSRDLGRLNKRLVAGRRRVRHALQDFEPSAAAVLDTERMRQYKKLMTHSLLDQSETRFLRDLIQRTTRQPDSEDGLLRSVGLNRNIAAQMECVADRLENVNATVIQRICLLLEALGDSESPLVDLSRTVLGVHSKSEREHRFTQVRNLITDQVLKPLQATSDAPVD